MYETQYGETPIPKREWVKIDKGLTETACKEISVYNHHFFVYFTVIIIIICTIFVGMIFIEITIIQ